MEMNDIQFRILDSIYFVEPFEKILEEVGEKENIVAAELKDLIRKGWVHVMEFQTDKGDFVKTFYYDTDNMRAFSYLASKEGLVHHNRR